jgi:MerR family copper efflux transcriptional regulator
MRITEAAQRLGTSPRMLRYRESLGLLPAVRQRPAGRPPAGRQHAGPQPAGRQQAGPQPAGPPSAARAAAASLTVTAAPRHRRFGAADLDAVALGLAIERRYDISPAALAFGVLVLSDPRVRAEVAELGRRIGRIQPPPARAIDFEKERALRLLNLPDVRRQEPSAGRTSVTPARR